MITQKYADLAAVTALHADEVQEAVLPRGAASLQQGDFLQRVSRCDEQEGGEESAGKDDDSQQGAQLTERYASDEHHQEHQHLRKHRPEVVVGAVKASCRYDRNNLEERAEEVDALLNGATEKEKENAENLVNSVNEQVDAGAVEEEVQETIDTAQEESEAIRQNVNDTLDEASQEINDSLNKVNSELDIMMATVNSNEKLDEEKKEELNKEADSIKKDIEAISIEKRGDQMTLFDNDSIS